MLGSQQVTNGGLTTSLTGFTVDGGTVEWDNGQASFTGTGGRLSQTLATLGAKYCQIDFDVTEITGTGFFYQGTTLLSSPTEAAHYTLYRVFSTDAFIAFGVSGGTAKFDNISVKEVLPPSITAIAESDGVVTLTVSAEGTVDIYSRAAGASSWTLELEDQAAGDVEISGLTAGATYEFYVLEYYNSDYLAPSNIEFIYLHDSSLPTISEVEEWAVGLITELAAFKTVDVWKHQIWAEKGGNIAGFDKYASFAFVGEIPTIAPRREGGYALNRKMRLGIFVGQKSYPVSGAIDDGAARVGDSATTGTHELRTLVIGAIEGQNPGGGLELDDFYYVGCEEVLDLPRMHLVQLIFEANWIVT